MVNPNGYIQGADGTLLELVDITARRQLAGKLDAPGGVKAGDYLRVQSIGADGTVVLEGAEGPGGGSGQNPNQPGLSDAAKMLLITILRNGVYNTNQSANITALEEALASSGGSGGGGDTPDVPDTGVTITQSGSVLTLSGVPAITSITQSGNVLTLA